jgi:hypothetical protein
MAAALRLVLPRLVLSAIVLSGTVASAGELTSTNFRLVGSHFSGMSSAALVSAGPRYSDSGVAMGQGDALGWSGGTNPSLTTSAPGFWPIVAGALPTLDVDGDGLASWIDDDDDGDGLLDTVETNTGVFAGASDTGTSAVDADSDDDGFNDGDEVAAGSDPNDDQSLPVAIPLGPLWAYGLLAAAMALAGRGLPRRWSAR